MRRLKSHAQRRIGPHTVKLKVGICTSIRAYAGLLRKSFRELQFNCGLFDRDRPLTAYVLIQIFKVIVNGELMFSCITELNDELTTRQSAGLGRNSDIEYISILPRTDHGIMPVNFRADR